MPTRTSACSTGSRWRAGSACRAAKALADTGPAPAMERDVDDGSDREETLAGKQRHAGTGIHYTV